MCVRKRVQEEEEEDGERGCADADVVYTAAARPPLVMKATARWKLSCF